MTNTNPARGMRDFLPSDVRKREYVIGIIKQVYENYGFEPLETPAVENIETLTGKYGEEGNQLIYKILKRGEKLDATAGERELSDLALRYDLTVPLARVVANRKNDLPKFFKRYQIQPVWRADRPARGRFREFYQCDVDAIGSSSMMVEAELCAAVSEILIRLRFDDFVIRVNHRKILSGLLNAVGIEEEKHTDALTAIDKLDKIGIDGVSKEFAQRGISSSSGERILKWFESIKNLWEDNDWNLEDWNKRIVSATGNLADRLSLKEVFDAFDDLKAIDEFTRTTLSTNRIKFDTSLARGLSYYTGAIFEIVLTKGDFAGSIGGGGRYDGLIGMFGKEQIPACGFSLGLERILVVMEERGMFQKLVDEGKLQLDSADVMIAAFDESMLDECLKLAGELRAAGLRTLVYPEANQKIKPFKYAEQVNVSFVCLVKESNLDEIGLTNMKTNEKQLVSRSEIAAKIQSQTKTS